LDLLRATSPAILDDTTQPPAVAAFDNTAAQLFLPLITVPGNSAFYLGWSTPGPFSEDDVGRWSDCSEAEIWLNVATDPAADSMVLEMTGLTNGAQEVKIAINGQPAGIIPWSGQPETQVLTFPASMMRPEELTYLTFSFPSAHFPNIRDQRPLGLALFDLRIARANGDDLPTPARAERPAAYPP
jgi:hypothetical protein